MGYCVLETTNFQFPTQKSVYHGKVRDVYDMGEFLLFIATDRYSAFDRSLALVPHKGELLTAISRWWFEQTSQIIKNHVIDYPDQQVTRGRKYRVLPIEMIVRGYITGVTNTSLWHIYQEGRRDFGEFRLPDGLHKNDKLPQPVLTPTTKFETHDRPLTPKEAIAEGLIEASTWQRLQDVALELFSFGQKVARSKGLILVDTKYEFGVDEKGELILIDELHTPDSSRYWRADTYERQIKAGEEPDNYDKEFLRLWFKSRFDPYDETDKAVPKPPKSIINELTKRYVYVYERLSGERFQPSTQPALARIEKNIKKSLGFAQ